MTISERNYGQLIREPGGRGFQERSLTEYPVHQRVCVLRRYWPAAIGRQRHRHVSPMGFAAQPQLVLKHELRVGHIAVASGDLLERWCEERCVARMTEHAAMLIHQC